MVAITKEWDHFIFEVLGFHKVWAFKSKITIPVSNVVRAYPNEKKMSFFLGLKIPGTHIPGIITAGTYLTKEGKFFIDVVNRKKSIVVELQNEYYRKLIIEVDDPIKALAFLNTK